MKFGTVIFARGLLLSLVFLSACTLREEKVVIEKQAPSDVRESFQKSRDASCSQASCITIQKESMGKIFLLLASGKTAGSTPQWYDLKPQVVSFEKSGGRLALLAENYNSIYSEIRTTNLIQTFKIVSEDEKSITFDWGGGIKTFVVQGSMDVDGNRGKNNNLTESSFSSMTVLDSFVRNIKFDEKNIELEQISKISSATVQAGAERSMEVENREETLGINVQIRAYNLSSDFHKKEYDKSRRVGFFVTKVSKPGFSQELTNLIVKWDISPSKGPIIVRISAAVPEDYVESVKEASLYWNKVFGRDILQVKTNVDPQAGPEDRSIFIRWIPWLDSGAAYASSQSDPLTGEILRAQVFMPSVFTRVGSADLVALNGNIPVAVGAVACDLSESFNALNKLAREASGSQRLRLAQDSVRATVAHEIGHALGLRHNFAGSFSSKVKTQDILSAAKSYLKDPAHPGLETSTSIMDYVSGIDEILMAARLKNAPLSYDKMALEWAYQKDDSALDERISKFCTDDDIALANSQALQIYGCERFDAGNNPMLRKYLDAKTEKDGFVNVLFTSIIGRLYPGDQPTVVNDLDVVLRDTLKWGRLRLEGLQFVSQLLMDKTKNSIPQFSFASIESVKSGQVLMSKMGMDEVLVAERMRSLQEAGGYAKLLNGLLRNQEGLISLDWLDVQIEDLKNSPYLAQGKSLAGRDFKLSPEQQEKVLNFFRSLNDLNKSTLLDGASGLLPKLDEKEQDQNGRTEVVSALLYKDLLREEDSDALVGFYLDLTLSQTEAIRLKVGPNLGDIIEVLKSNLSVADRIKWSKVLSTKGLSFNMELKKALISRFQHDRVNHFLKAVDPNLDLSIIKNPEELPEQLLQQGLIDDEGLAWLADEIAVLSRLK